MSTDSALRAPRSELGATIRAWWTILRIALEERLVYRGDFMLGTLMRFLPLVTQVFLWTAIFSVVQKDVAGYSKDELIAYYILVNVGRAFSSMPGLASSISRSILDGSIKKFLIQPVDMIGYLLLTRVAHKLVYYLVAFIPFAIVFFLCRSYFPGWPAPHVFIAFLASLVMAFLLGYFLDACIGMIGFWFLEVTSLLFVYMLLNYFLCGQMFPIELLDGVKVFGNFSAGDAVRILPFQYMAYFPTAVFLGKVAGTELVTGLAINFAWVVFFVFASRFMFNRG